MTFQWDSAAEVSLAFCALSFCRSRLSIPPGSSCSPIHIAQSPCLKKHKKQTNKFTFYMFFPSVFVFLSCLQILAKHKNTTLKFWAHFWHTVYNISPSTRFPWIFRGFPFLNPPIWGPGVFLVKIPTFRRIHSTSLVHGAKAEPRLIWPQPSRLNWWTPGFFCPGVCRTI